MKDLSKIYGERGLAGVSKYGSEQEPGGEAMKACQAFIQEKIEKDFNLWGLMSGPNLMFPECEVMAGDTPIVHLFTGKKLCRKKAYNYTQREGMPIPVLIADPLNCWEWLRSMGVKDILLDEEVGVFGGFWLEVPDGPGGAMNMENNLELLRKFDAHRCSLGRAVSFVVDKKDFKDMMVYVFPDIKGAGVHRLEPEGENDPLREFFVDKDGIIPVFTNYIEAKMAFGGRIAPKQVRLGDFTTDQHIMINPYSMAAHVKMTID